MATTKELEERIAKLEADTAARLPDDHIAVICWSGDMDKVLSSYMLATGAALMGSKVTIFFTFWGLLAMKKSGNVKKVRELFLQKMFSWMLPNSPEKLRLSRYNMLGLGGFFFRKLLKKQGGAGPTELRDQAIALGIDFIICTHSMQMLGIKREELLDLGGEDHYCGVANFSQIAKRCSQVYFV